MHGDVYFAGYILKASTKFNSFQHNSAFIVADVHVTTMDCTAFITCLSLHSGCWTPYCSHSIRVLTNENLVLSTICHVIWLFRFLSPWKYNGHWIDAVSNVWNASFNHRSNSKLPRKSVAILVFLPFFFLFKNQHINSTDNYNFKYWWQLTVVSIFQRLTQYWCSVWLCPGQSMLFLRCPSLPLCAHTTLQFSTRITCTTRINKCLGRLFIDSRALPPYSSSNVKMRILIRWC